VQNITHINKEQITSTAVSKTVGSKKTCTCFLAPIFTSAYNVPSFKTNLTAHFTQHHNPVDSVGVNGMHSLCDADV